MFRDLNWSDTKADYVDRSIEKKLCRFSIGQETGISRKGENMVMNKLGNEIYTLLNGTPPSGDNMVGLSTQGYILLGVVLFGPSIIVLMFAGFFRILRWKRRPKRYSYLPIPQPDDVEGETREVETH